VTGLPTGQISGVMKRVFTDTWAPEDVVTIATALHQPNTSGLPHGLVKAAAERLHAKVPTRPDQIQPLIDRVFRLAEQKTTSDPAVRWLTETIGIDRIEGMNDRDRVRFLISALPQDNHRGAGPHESKTWNRLEELRQQTANIPEQWLLEADVTMAVGFANVMNFEEAARWLSERWSGGRSPESIPGLATEAGKFHSSLGQYEAFLGRYDVAEEHFKRAIALLERIDEPKTKLDQITQTKTYLAFALLEHDVPRADEVIDELLRLNVRVSLADAGAFFAGTSQSPYLHHLFVRRATMDGFDASAYVNARADWQRQSFHPWELTDWGRAKLLLDVDRNTAARCLSRACETALGGTSVLAAIGTVIAAYGACMHLLPAGPLLDRALGRAVREQHSKHVHLDFQKVIDAMCDPHPEQASGLISLLPFNYH
jgi:tetratricopeptide (TPR) repeat protein